jgi:hypothetical protein
MKFSTSDHLFLVKAIGLAFYISSSFCGDIYIYIFPSIMKTRTIAAQQRPASQIHPRMHLEAAQPMVFG